MEGRGRVKKSREEMRERIRVGMSERVKRAEERRGGEAKREVRGGERKAAG